MSDIFPDETALKTETVKLGCGYAEYTVAADGTRQLRRLISTNPADYLKAEYQPQRFYT